MDQSFVSVTVENLINVKDYQIKPAIRIEKCMVY